MKVFLTGATGYIGGSVAAGLISAGHEIHGLVRSEERAALVRKKGITPVIGSLDDADILSNAARDADAVVHTANADHVASTQTLLAALADSGKLYLHTSGSSIVGTPAEGELVEGIYDETTSFTPSPGRVGRVALNKEILESKNNGLRPVIVCPSLIYGLGTGVNLHSMQVPWLIEVARKFGAAKHIGSGANIWSNVHIDDLVKLYLLAFDNAPAGGFYYAENGENSMAELCQSISRMLGYGGGTVSMTVEEAAEEWGEGPARYTMASNSRVRGVAAREQLKWAPNATSAIDEIERGCYA